MFSLKKYSNHISILIDFDVNFENLIEAKDFANFKIEN